MHNIHLFFEHFRIQAGRRGRRSCAGMVGRCGSGRKSHKSLQFLEGQLQRHKAELPSSAQTIQQGTVSTSPWRFMFTSQPSPPSVCLHKALLTSALVAATQEVAPPGSSRTLGCCRSTSNTHTDVQDWLSQAPLGSLTGCLGCSWSCCLTTTGALSRQPDPMSNH